MKTILKFSLNQARVQRITILTFAGGFILNFKYIIEFIFLNVYNARHPLRGTLRVT